MSLAKKILKKIIRDQSIDDRINKNIQNFVKSIDPNTVKYTSRPADFCSKLEIIIPCYNHGKFLKESFGSIQYQTSRYPLTVTLINDNSTDNSLNVMEKIKQQNNNPYLNINIINNHRNLLQGGSLNSAINQSRNELFIILNADDLLIPDCIDLIINTYKRERDIFMLGGSSLWFESGKNLPKFIPKPLKLLTLKKYGPSDAQYFTEPNDINMSQSSCSFFKSAWKLVGGYLPLEKRVCSYDDRDFQMRVCSVLPIGIYEDYPMVFYRTDSSLGRGRI